LQEGYCGFFTYILSFSMEKKDRSKWTDKFKELGKKKGSRSDFIKIYKELKEEKEKNQDPLNSKKNKY
jgi:hypothetical protein